MKRNNNWYDLWIAVYAGLIVTGIYATVLIFALLISGCTGTNERTLEEAKACGRGPECQVIWDEWNAREESIMRRQKAQEAMDRMCEKDYVLSCKGHGTRHCVDEENAKINRWCECGCIPAGQNLFNL